MTLTKNSAVGDSSVALLLEQFKEKANFNALVRAFSAGSQSLEDACADLIAKSQLATAIGERLEFWGKVVGCPNEYQNDDEYRLAIYLQIAINTSKGKPEDLIAVSKKITDASGVQYSQRDPATAVLYNHLARLTKHLSKLESAATGGVKIVATASEDTPFVFGEGRDAYAGWTNLVAQPDTPLTHREDHAIWYHYSGLSILQGGNGDDQTWTWDGTASWNHITPSPHPDTWSITHVAPFPPVGHGLIYLGGNGGETWLWDGSWTQISSIGGGTQPQVDMRRMMAYLPATHKIYCMGTSGGNLTVWAYDGATHTGKYWYVVATTNTPSAREYAGLCYDPVSEKLLLYGGTPPAGGDPLSATYLFDGTNFELQTVTVQPPARTCHVLAPCNAAGTPALIGGFWYESGIGHTTSGVWVWTGDDWKEVVTPVTIHNSGEGTAEEQSVSRWNAAGFYDPIAGGLIMNGGKNFTTDALSDTWLFTYEPWQNGEDDPDGEGFNELTETEGGEIVELYSS